MARLSDVIEAFIKQLIEDTNGVIEIQRNELANHFNCVPSQINYVIDTRFSTDKGYFVESRRGGGGHIRIKRMNVSCGGNYIMHIVSSMGDSISQQSADVFINNFVDYDVISKREGLIIKAALSDRILGSIAPIQRDMFRAALLKNMLAALL